MATVGKLLDRKEAQHYMDYYFDQMKEVGLSDYPANTTLQPNLISQCRVLQTAEKLGRLPSGNRLKFMIQVC